MEYKLNEGGLFVNEDQAAFICNADGTLELHLPRVAEGEAASDAVKFLYAIAMYFEDTDQVEYMRELLREDGARIH